MKSLSLIYLTSPGQLAATLLKYLHTLSLLVELEQRVSFRISYIDVSIFVQGDTSGLHQLIALNGLYSLPVFIHHTHFLPTPLCDNQLFLAVESYRPWPLDPTDGSPGLAQLGQVNLHKHLERTPTNLLPIHCDAQCVSSSNLWCVSGFVDPSTPPLLWLRGQNCPHETSVRLLLFVSVVPICVSRMKRDMVCLLISATLIPGPSAAHFVGSNGTLFRGLLECSRWVPPRQCWVQSLAPGQYFLHPSCTLVRICWCIDISSSSVIFKTSLHEFTQTLQLVPFGSPFSGQ